MAKEDYSGIWVFAEQKDGVINSTVYELLAKAKELKACCGEKVSAVLLGYNVSCLSNDLFSYGADQVIVADNQALTAYSARPYQAALTQLVQKYRPSILLYGATAIGRDLAPRMMVSLNTGLTADAIDVCFDECNDFCQTTPAYGGKIMAHIAILNARPQMVTVHSQIIEAMEPIDGASGELVIENVNVHEDVDYEVLGTYELENSGSSLTDTDTVIAGGRGIKSEDDLEMLKRFAELLSGKLACSRPLVDKGWLPHDKQIGQSGLTVTPNLIFNIAISGSVQYMLGMQKSKCIIAVNQSEDAPIFDIADYGIVGDYRKVVPALIEALKS